MSERLEERENEPWARAARRRRRQERKTTRRSPSGPLRSSKSGEQ